MEFEDSCKHVTRPQNPLQSTAAGRAMFSSTLYEQVHCINEATGWNMLTAAMQINSNKREAAIFELASGFDDFPDLATVDAAYFFLEVSVDAFLNHDFRFACAFYALSLVIDSCIKAGSSEALFQSSLSPIYVDNPQTGLVTPWNTPIIRHPVGRSQDDIIARFLALLKSIHSIMDEPSLLAAMLFNPAITCTCLQVEDPYHPRFGQINSTDQLFPVQLEDQPRPYSVNCQACGRLPQHHNSFKSCARCKRVRYCSVACQKTDWRAHKAKCGEKRASWWNRAPPMREETRRHHGFP